MIKIKVKKLQENAIIPTQGSKDSAGFDVYSVEDMTLLPLSVTAISTGIAIEPEINNELKKDFSVYTKVESRSGLCKKFNLHAEAGIIDLDYRGEIKVLVANTSKKAYQVKKGDKIAQLIVNIIPKVTFEEDKELSDTERGQNGFGSTGK